MKKYGNILIVLGIISVVFAAGCTSSSSATGRVVFAAEDAAADMGSVSSIMMTVDSVRVHSEAQGWTTVSSSARTYDLLDLKASGNAALLADANIAAGTYDQMRLDISSIVVTDVNGTHQAKLPSNEFKVVGDLVVHANSTSTATFDFIADQSLHVTGNGQYIFAPVVQIETRSNTNVQVASNTDVRINGGSVNTNIRVGMDTSGNVGVGLGIPANANVSIGAGGGIVIGSGALVSTSGSGSTSGSVSANVTVSAKVQTGQSVTLYSGETAEVTHEGTVYYAKFVSSVDSNTATVMVGSTQASVDAGTSAKVGGLDVYVENVYDVSGSANDYARMKFGVNATAGASGGSTY